MFTHQGKTRTLAHNLRIASLLSFVAGIVNVAGFLAVQKLTTNVTGHFAFFVDEILQLHFWKGFVYFLYIFFFFLGSFVSSYLVELISQKTERNIYVFPTSIEIVILFSIGLFGGNIITEQPNIIACSLLFSMGLQNSLVTKISNATVRTTHLTGLFTDLGIELSQLFFYKENEMKTKLYSSIKLRLTIISFFFIGGIIGGLLYVKIDLKVLFIAGITLLFGLIYDNLKLKIIMLNRKYNP
ncbi:YoaK family protein [Flavobacterium sp.]|uniref:YoaK family protein n=1 Tax=Flavobacterium sp. TaxID=239 RepID=UPI0026032E07|nr:YoaK family protein [Flavobacterium sp.]